MVSDSENQRQYEERVKRRVLILKKLIEEKKIVTPSDSQSIQSLSAVKFDISGQPDLKTVDGFVRSMALIAEQFHDRGEIKKSISSIEIQKRYFQYLESNFGMFYEKMLEFKLNPHQAAYNIAHGNENIDFLDKNIELVLNDIFDFWEIHKEAALIHAEDDFDSIKAIFGGDLFPSNSENIASKCGIYTDTIILPCPFIRSKNLFNKWDKNQRVYYLLKHALNCLQYKTLALAETDKPIIIILPDKEMMAELDRTEVIALGRKDTVFHANKIFGRSFESPEELFDFAKEFDTVEKVLKVIKDDSKILFDLDNTGSIGEQLKNEIENGVMFQVLGTKNPGTIVASLGLGRMTVCNELLLKAQKLRGIPLIEAPTSWQYFKWKLEYDTERTYRNKDFSKLHIVKGLNGLSNTPLQWIGKIPPEGLIELRRTGAINELRTILSKGIKDLENANEFDFNATSNKVFENLNLAFRQHTDNIRILKNKKWKFAGKDIGSWLAIGTIEVAAACLGTPLLGLSSIVANQLLDAPKIKDIPASIKKLQKEDSDLKKSPIGIMFKYKK